MLRGQVGQRQPALHHLGGVRVVVGHHLLELTPPPVVVYQGGECLDARAAGRSAHVEERAQKVVELDRPLERNVGVDRPVAPELDDLPRIEPEGARRAPHGRVVVLRHHEQVIAGAVGGAPRQPDLDVARGAAGRVVTPAPLQLVVDDHLGLVQAEDCSRRILGASPEHASLEALREDAARTGWAWPSGVDSRPQALAPRAEGALVVARRVSLAGLQDALPAEPAELGVEQVWHGLVGLAPVRVTASKHGVPDAVRSTGGRRRQPPHEVRRARGRLAVVRGGDDHERRPDRKRAHPLIERLDVRVVAAAHRAVRQIAAQLLGRSPVGRVGEREPAMTSTPTSGDSLRSPQEVGELGAVAIRIGGGGRGGAQRGDAGTGSEAELQVARLQGEAELILELGAYGIADLETPRRASRGRS